MEGETILVLGTLAAHQGYLALDALIAFAYAGAVLGDQLAFHLGRWHGARVFARFPSLAARTARARDLSDRHASWLILVFRMVFGMRVVLPLLWGMGRMSGLRFLLFDTLGAAIWVSVVVGLAWSLGRAAEHLIGDLGRYESLGLGLILGVGIASWVGRLVIRRLRGA